MSNQNQNTAVAAVQPKHEIEYVPFGADSKVKLSAKIVTTYLCKPTKQGHVCTESDAIRFMMLCQARALNPFEGDAFIVGYDSQNGPEFSMITAHQAFLKRAEIHPDYDGMQSGVLIRDGAGDLKEIEGDFYDEEQTLVGGWATVYLKTKTYPVKARVKLSTFKKETRFWKDNPGGMICKTAEADALRRAFPTKLGGLQIAEERLTEEGRFAAARPVGRLLEAQEEREAQAAQLPPPVESDSDTGRLTQQELLRAFVEQAGFDWPTFDLWASGTGQIPEGTKWGSWDDISTDVATRLLRSPTGLKKGLKEASVVVTNQAQAAV